MNNIFRTNDFAIQVISSGSFLDDSPGCQGKIYLVETATIRLNHIAWQEWLDTRVSNCWKDYETDLEWQAYLSKKERLLKTFNDKIAAAVGYDSAAGSVYVTQVLSEVFTVVHIRKAEKEANK